MSNEFQVTETIDGFGVEMTAEEYAATAASEWAWTTEEISALAEHFCAAMAEARAQALREAIEFVDDFEQAVQSKAAKIVASNIATALRKLAGGAS